MKKLVSVGLAAADGCFHELLVVANNPAETTAAAAAAETTAAAGETECSSRVPDSSRRRFFKIGVTGPLTGAGSSLRQRSCKRRRAGSRGDQRRLAVSTAMTFEVNG